jgi:hypothetical protein
VKDFREKRFPIIFKDKLTELKKDMIKDVVIDFSTIPSQHDMSNKILLRLNIPNQLQAIYLPLFQHPCQETTSVHGQ